MIRGLWTAIAAALTLLPIGARAELRPSSLVDHAPGAPPVTVDIEFGWYLDEEDGDVLHGFPIVASVSYRVVERAEIELDWPFAYFSLSPDGGEGFSEFVSGNPFAAGYYVHPLTDGYVRVGGGLALPVANVDAQALERGGFGEMTAVLRELLPLMVAAGARGYWDLWLYTNDRLSLVLPAQIESRHEVLLLGADTALAYLIGTDDELAQNDELLVQLAGSIGAGMENVALGLRAQAVLSPTGNGEDWAQLSLVPFVQGELVDSGFAYARFVLNLDEPLGVLGSSGEVVWGLHLGGGGRF